MDIGVAWLTFARTEGAARRACAAREREGRVVALLSADSAAARRAARALVARGIPAAEARAADMSVSDADFVDFCLGLRGEPWDQGPERRRMRERARAWKHLDPCVFGTTPDANAHAAMRSMPVDAASSASGPARTQARLHGEPAAGAASQASESVRKGDGPEAPTSVGQLFALWETVWASEPRVLNATLSARFRATIPFSTRPFLPKDLVLAPGKETVAIDDVPRETEALLRFLARRDIETELQAAAAYAAFLHVHPFTDGNGRTGRLLTATILARSYCPLSLLGFIRALHDSCVEVSQTITDMVRTRGDVAPFAELVLDLLLEGQRTALEALGVAGTQGALGASAASRALAASTASGHR